MLTAILVVACLALFFSVVGVVLVIALGSDTLVMTRALDAIESRLDHMASRVDPEAIELSLREARRNARRARKESSL